MVDAHLTQVAAILDGIDRNQVEAVLNELRQIRNHDGRLFIIGNGGGAGHASHAAADFRKIGRIESYAWGENLSDLTAYVNDEGWACSTTRWLEDSRCGHDDAVLVFSVGGSSREVSQNLKEAIYWAKGGPRVLGIVGQAGGYVAKHADAHILIPSTSTPHVEGIQAVLWHCLVTSL
jgi:D-sedoheptulose 7-phosphate isomerase